jgi:hypothetical protein
MFAKHTQGYLLFVWTRTQTTERTNIRSLLRNCACATFKLLRIHKLDGQPDTDDFVDELVSDSFDSDVTLELAELDGAIEDGTEADGSDAVDATPSDTDSNDADSSNGAD